MTEEAQTPQAQEQAPETIVEQVKETLSEVAQKVAAEVKEAKGEVEKVVEKAVVELEAEDKLAMSQIENNFLKVQLEIHQHNAEITRLNNIAKQIQDKFKADTEALYKKYKKKVGEDILDLAAFVFRKNQTNNQ